MHLCLIPSHDESRGPSFNRRAEQRRNFILTSPWGPQEFPCSGSGHAAPRQVLSRPGLSRTMSGVGHHSLGLLLLAQAVLGTATTRECCPCPAIPASCPQPAQEKPLLLEPCLPPSRGQLVPPQGCLALGRKAAWAGEVCWELLSNLLHRYMELAGAKPWLSSANSQQFFPCPSMAKTADAEWTLHNWLGSAVAGRGQVRNSTPHWDTWTCGSPVSRSPVKELGLQATVGREGDDLLLSRLPICLESQDDPLSSGLGM